MTPIDQYQRLAADALKQFKGGRIVGTRMTYLGYNEALAALTAAAVELCLAVIGEDEPIDNPNQPPGVQILRNTLRQSQRKQVEGER